MPDNISLSEGGSAIITGHADMCPVCHFAIDPIVHFGTLRGRKFQGQMRIVYTCPNRECNELFIGYFEEGNRNENNRYRLLGTRPFQPEPPIIPSVIKETSANFMAIYTQAHRAEQLNLDQICGVGYRKALEFLMKDYLIKRRPNEKTRIEKLSLGTCINNYVDDLRIKEMSSRAVWLGNDETHYQRQWIDKDLGDLKRLIALTMHWIEMEVLHEETLRSMPPRGAATTDSMT